MYPGPPNIRPNAPWKKLPKKADILLKIRYFNKFYQFTNGCNQAFHPFFETLQTKDKMCIKLILWSRHACMMIITVNSVLICFSYWLTIRLKIVYEPGVSLAYVLENTWHSINVEQNAKSNKRTNDMNKFLWAISVENDLTRKHYRRIQW